MGKGYRFCQLNKAQKEAWLPRLFDLLHENMHVIAPSGLSYADEKALWHEFLTFCENRLDDVIAKDEEVAVQ